MTARPLALLAAFAAGATLATGALAQSAPAAAASAPEPPVPPVPLTANIAITTKYKFRGQDQGNTKWASPAVQGGFDWTANGFYLGNWNSNVSFSNAAIEMDFYGGYRGTISGDFGYDVGILEYYYPQKDKQINFNTTELYGALTWQWLSFKYSHTVSKDYFGAGEAQDKFGGADGSRPKGRNTGYFDLTANYPLVDKLTLNGHVGYTRLAKDIRDAKACTEIVEAESTKKGALGAPGVTCDDLGLKNFWDYKLGVTYDMSAIAGSGVSVAAAYVGATKKGFYGDINKGRVILTLSKTF